MLKRVLAGAVAVTLAAALSVPAQAQLSMQKPAFDVNIGLAVPFGDAGDISNVGLSVGADGFLWTALDNKLEIGGRVAYNNFGSKDQNDGWGAEVSSDFSAVEVVPTARYHFTSNGPLGFFAQAGLGLFFKSAEAEAQGWGGSVSADDSKTSVGITIGGGATYALSNGMQLMAMPLLHITGDNYLTVNVGVLFGK